MATFYGTAGNDRLSGTGEDDILFGHGGSDTLSGGGGADALYGGTGNDTLYGGAGNDTYFSGEAGDRIFEAFSAGIDEVRAWTTHGLADYVENLTLFTPGTTGYGNNWNNRLVAAEGEEVLFGHGGSDTLIGLGGSDALYGGTGVDEMIGGTGNDTYFAGETYDRVIEEAGAGIDEVRAWTSRTLSDNVENLILYTAGTSGTGNALANRITGAGGSETLDGGAGDDTLEGGSGSDVLSGGGGTDVAVFAGNRADYAIFVRDGKRVVVDRLAQVDGDDGEDTIEAVERLAFKDGTFSVPLEIELSWFPGSLFRRPDGTLYDHDGWVGLRMDLWLSDPPKADLRLDWGDGAVSSGALYNVSGHDRLGVGHRYTEAGTYHGSVTLTDLRGNSEVAVFTVQNPHAQTGVALAGNADADALLGHVGDDTLQGGDGCDYLFGGQGSDVLDGGTSADALVGWTGNDRFVFAPGHGRDTIADFGLGDDVLDLSAFGTTYGYVMAHTFQIENDHLSERSIPDCQIDLTDIGGGVITLYDVDHRTLTAADFLFA